MGLDMYLTSKRKGHDSVALIEKALASCEELEALLKQQMEKLKLMEKGVLQQIDKTRAKMKDLQHNRAKLIKLKGD